MLERADDMPDLSDHRSLLCQMTITAPSKSKRTVTSRNTKAVSLPDFQVDIKCFTDRYSQCPKRDLADSYSDSHGLPRPSGHTASAPDAQPRGRR